MRTPPVFADYSGSDWTDAPAANGNEVTGSVTWLTDDRIIVVGATADSGITLGVPTATGLTFVQEATTGGASNANTYYWKAVASSGGSSAVTSARAGGVNQAAGISAFVIRGGDAGNKNTLVGSANKEISLTRVMENSGAILVLADWNAVNDTVVDPNPSGGTQRVAQATAFATFFVFNWGDQGAEGTANYGISNHTGVVDMSGIVVEMTGNPITASAGWLKA